MSFGKYLKSAFLNQWNMLLFLGGMAFAAMSGSPDIAIPLVLAAEVGYVTAISAHPKFQKYVEAQEAQAARGDALSNDEVLRRMLNALPKPSLRRFEALRSRAREVQQIALDLKEPGRSRNPGQLDDMQLSGLDRLLWIYLKLLFTEYSLGRFLETTEEDQLRTDVSDLESRVAAATASKAPNRDRLLATLQDSLKAVQDRLANFLKARENYELVQLEIERLENKIRSLSELAVNRQEPDYISGQVNAVAGSMLETERTINDLQFVTGLDSNDDQVPELVRRETTLNRH